jgi:rhodanese-related sulfurtransferase
MARRGEKLPGRTQYSSLKKERNMKTIHPLDLEAKIDANEIIEILDLRSRPHFEKRHVHGAHSLPFDEFDTASLLHCRELPLSEPLYVISQKGGHARLAADAMEECGLDNLIVVEGGMENWERNGLPVVRRDLGTWLRAHRDRMFSTGMATELGAIAAHS